MLEFLLFKYTTKPSMEISQIFEHIFKNQTNINALVVIIVLTGLALFGTFKSENIKIRHFAKQSPAILATVGIFFSFWGISIGLIGLNLEDIQQSIPNLLEGLKAKFLASLMGILASIIVRIAQSFSVNEESAEANLDDKIIHLLGDIHSVLAENANNSPETLLRELKQSIDELPVEFRKQSSLLDSIKSSLAGEGDASVTTQLSKLRMDMRDALKDIDKSNKQRSDSLNNTLTSNFDNLTQKFDDFAKIVAENNSKAFIEALEAAMRDFNNNITEQFGENFKELNRAVGELLKWQDNYKAHVETLTGNFEVALTSIINIQSAFNDIEKRSQSFAVVSTELSTILQKLDAQLQDLNLHLKSLSQVADTAKEAFPTIEDNLTKLTAGFKKSTEQSLTDIQNTVESVSENLVEATSRLKDTTGKLRDSMENQRETIETTSTEFKEIVGTTLKSLAKETKTNIDTYSELLKEAVTDTGTVLKNSTDTVANHLTNATNSMKGIIEEQQSALTVTSTEFKTVVNQTLRDLSQETQSSIQNYQTSLQQAVTQQLDSIDANIQKSNAVVNSTIQNVSAEFEKAIETQAESMNKMIATVGDSFKTVIQDTAKEFEDMAQTIAESIDIQEKTLVNVSQDVKLAVEKTLRDLNEQSKHSIKEYEDSLHNIIMSQFNTVKDAVNTASKDFNRLLTENTSKSTSVLEQQTQQLDAALQAELKKAIETMGKHLAALSNQFVQDYRPLTDKLREVVKLAEDLKMRGR